MKYANSSKHNHHDNSFYMWAKFLLTLILLTIASRQRLNNPSNLTTSTPISDSQDTASYDSLIATYSGPLFLSGLAHQYSNSFTIGFLLALNAYSSKSFAQPTVPALTVNLNNLKPSEGITFSAGSSVDAGDVNGDGHVDLLIGDYAANAAYLIYGPNFAAASNLTTLDASQGVTFIGGNQTGSYLKLTDMNNDTKLDLLIGAGITVFGAQKVYLVYGNQFVNSVVFLDDLNSTTGAIFLGSPGSGLGYSFATGDLNHDGHEDLILGANILNTVYIVHGPNFPNKLNLETMNYSQGIILTGPTYTGVSLSIADFNKDGNLDILIGAFGANKVYLMYGPNFNNTSDLNTLNPTQGVIFSSNTPETGVYVYSKDVDLDGNIDILIGARSLNNPKTFLLYGPNFSNSSNLDLTRNRNVIFTGGVRTGHAIFVADANADGHMDIFIGSPGATNVYLNYGPHFERTTDLNNLNITQGVVFTGGALISFLALMLYDFNNDTKPDAFIGSADGNKAYIVYNHVFNIGSYTVDSTSKTQLTTTASTSQSPKLTTTITNPETIQSARSVVITSNKEIYSTPFPSNSTDNSNYVTIGAAVGTCIIGTILGALGFFAINKCRNKNNAANTNELAMNSARDELSRSNSSQYQSASLRQQAQSNVAQKNYVAVDENKKIENQYDNAPKF